jgi:hypothetical protein
MAIGGAEVMGTSRTVAGRVTMLGVLALSACATEAVTTTAMTPATVAPPPPPSVAVRPPTAPIQPPPVHADLVPPPPAGDGPVVWQPGHWDYTGRASNPWAWHDGH